MDANSIELLKQKTAEAAIRSLQKKFGDNIVQKLSDIPPLDFIPTRFAGLNAAIGLGGIPIGLVTELIGDEGAGKTTLALTLAADAMTNGRRVLYIDIEGKVRAEYAEKLGVSMDLEFSRPSNGDEAMLVADNLISTRAFDLVILDSVALLSTESELEKDINEANMATTARLLSQSMRRLQPKCRINNCALLFINQFRQSPTPYGNPNKPSGGRALQYASALTIDIKDGALVKKDNRPIGKEVKLRVVKNQVGLPYSDCELTMMFGTGFDQYYDLYNSALKAGVIKVGGGGWITYKDEKLVQGKDNCVDLLKSSPAFYSEVQQAIADSK